MTNDAVTVTHDAAPHAVPLSGDGGLDANAFDPTALADRTFDLLVIGGGILGAGVARDAALRGLSVALIDTADFALDGVSDEVRGLISPVLLATDLERLSAHLEVLRDHPLTE